jgi:tetratricopeptide (TPR) repeat protein
MVRVAKSLERVQSALQNSRYRDAIKAAAAVPKSNLEHQQLSHLMDAMLTAAAGLADGSRDELLAYDLVITLGDQIAPGDVFRPAVQLRVNAALFNKGVVLAQLGRGEEAISTYDDLVRRSGGSREAGLRENAARALFNKGASLAGLDRREEAIVVYDDLVKRFSNSKEPVMREAVGKAMVNKGIALAELNRLSEAISVLDEVLSRWTDSPDPVLRERAAKALINKASALIQLGRTDEARLAYEKVAATYGADPQPTLREQVAIARVRKEILEDSLS